MEPLAMWYFPFRRTTRNPAPAIAADAPKVRCDIAEVELIGSTAVATLTITELSRAEGLEGLAGLIDDLVICGAKHVVLDIRNVQFMDSACLAWLVAALNRLAVRGGRIALANAAHSVRNVFRLSRLDRLFPVCHDVMAALEAVEGSGKRD